MKTFVTVIFVLAVLQAIIGGLVLGTVEKWPREVKRGIGHYLVGIIEAIVMAAWAAYVLWA